MNGRMLTGMRRVCQKSLEQPGAAEERSTRHHRTSQAPAIVRKLKKTEADLAQFLACSLNLSQTQAAQSRRFRLHFRAHWHADASKLLISTWALRLGFVADHLRPASIPRVAAASRRRFRVRLSRPELVRPLNCRRAMCM